MALEVLVSSEAAVAVVHDSAVEVTEHLEEVVVHDSVVSLHSFYLGVAGDEVLKVLMEVEH